MVPALVTENAQVQRTLFKRNLDEAHEYEVLVVVGDRRRHPGRPARRPRGRRAGARGRFVSVPHPRGQPATPPSRGAFRQERLGLFPDFSFANYVNVDGSAFAGRQAFNLGGRSVFWGGSIPRMGAWELEASARCATTC